jgi:hypothetical protein
LWGMDCDRSKSGLNKNPDRRERTFPNKKLKGEFYAIRTEYESETCLPDPWTV